MIKFIVRSLLLTLLTLQSCNLTHWHDVTEFNEAAYDRFSTEELQRLNVFVNKPDSAYSIQEDIYAKTFDNLYYLVQKCKENYAGNNVAPIVSFFKKGDHHSFTEKFRGYNKIDFFVFNGNLDSLINGIPKDSFLIDVINSVPFKKCFLINRETIDKAIRGDFERHEFSIALGTNTAKYLCVEQNTRRLYDFVSRNDNVSELFLTKESSNRIKSGYFKLSRLEFLIKYQLCQNVKDQLPDGKYVFELSAFCNDFWAQLRSQPLIKNNWLTELLRLRMMQAKINLSANYCSKNYIDINKNKASSVWIRIFFGDSLSKEMTVAGKIRRMTGLVALVSNDEFKLKENRPSVIKEYGTWMTDSSLNALNSKINSKERVVPLGIEITNLSIKVSDTLTQYVLNDFDRHILLDQYVRSGFSQIIYTDDQEKFSKDYIKDLTDNISLKRTAINFENWDITFINSWKLPSFYQKLNIPPGSDDLIFKLSELNGLSGAKSIQERIFRCLRDKAGSWKERNKDFFAQVVQNQIKGAKLISIASSTYDSLRNGIVNVSLSVRGKADTVAMNYFLDDSISFSLKRDYDLTGKIQGEIKDALKNKIVELNQNTSDMVAAAAANLIITKRSPQIKWNPKEGIYISDTNARISFTPGNFDLTVNQMAKDISGKEIEEIRTAIESPNPVENLCTTVLQKHEVVNFYGLVFKLTSIEDCKAGIFVATCEDRPDLFIKVKFSGDKFVQVIDFDANKILDEVKVKINEAFKGIDILEFSEIKYQDGSIVVKTRFNLKVFGINYQDAADIVITLNSSSVDLNTSLGNAKDRITAAINSYLQSNLSNLHVQDGDYESLKLRQVQLLDLQNAHIKGEFDISLIGFSSIAIPFEYDLKSGFKASVDLAESARSLGMGLVTLALNKISAFAGFDNLTFYNDNTYGPFGLRVEADIKMDVGGYNIAVPASIVFSINHNPEFLCKPNWESILSNLEIPIGPVLIYGIRPEEDFSQKKFSVSCDVTLFERSVGMLIRCEGKTTINFKTKIFKTTGQLVLLSVLPIGNSEVNIDANIGRLEALCSVGGSLSGLFNLGTSLVIQANTRTEASRSLCASNDIFVVQSKNKVQLLGVLNVLNAEADLTLHVNHTGLGMVALGSTDFLGIAKLDCEIKGAVDIAHLEKLLDVVEVTVHGEVGLGVVYGKLYVHAIPLRADVEVSLEAGSRICVLCGCVGAGFKAGLHIKALNLLSSDMIQANFEAKAEASFNLKNCNFCLGANCSNAPPPPPGNGGNPSNGNNQNNPNSPASSDKPGNVTDPDNPTGPNSAADPNNPNSPDNPNTSNVPNMKPSKNENPGNGDPNGQGVRTEPSPPVHGKGKLGKRKFSQLKDEYIKAEEGDFLFLRASMEYYAPYGPTSDFSALENTPLPDISKMIKSEYSETQRLAKVPLHIIKKLPKNGVDFQDGSKYYFLEDQSEWTIEKYLDDIFGNSNITRTSAPFYEVIPNIKNSVSATGIGKPMARLVSEAMLTAPPEIIRAGYKVDTNKFFNFPNQTFCFFKPKVDNSFNRSNQCFFYSKKEGSVIVPCFYIISDRNCGSNNKFFDQTNYKRKSQIVLISEYHVFWNNKPDQVDFLIVLEHNSSFVEFFPIFKEKITDKTVGRFYPKYADYVPDELNNSYNKFNRAPFTINTSELGGLFSSPIDINEVAEAFDRLEVNKGLKMLFDYKILSDGARWARKAVTSNNELLEIHPFYTNSNDPKSLSIGLFKKDGIDKPVIDYQPQTDLTKGLNLFKYEDNPGVNQEQFDATEAKLFGFHYNLHVKNNGEILLLNSRPNSLSYLLAERTENGKYFKNSVATSRTGTIEKNKIIFTNKTLSPTSRTEFQYSDFINYLKINQAQVIDALLSYGKNAFVYYELDDNLNIIKSFAEVDGNVLLTWKLGNGSSRVLSVPDEVFNENFRVFAQKGNYKLSGLPMKQLEDLIANPDRFMERVELVLSSFEDWDKGKSKINPIALFRPVDGRNK